jgi:hypothetical protein
MFPHRERELLCFSQSHLFTRRPVAACHWFLISQARQYCASFRATLSFVEDVYGATTPALDAPPVSDALPMKLAKTLQPAHLLARLELFHANRAFLLAPVAVHAVFLGGDVREDATRAVRHGASSGVGRRVGCGGGAEGGWEIWVAWVRRRDGAQIRCWSQMRGWSREAAANAGLDVCLADCIAWGHFDSADRTFVFFFDLTAAQHRGVRRR